MKKSNNKEWVSVPSSSRTVTDPVWTYATKLRIWKTLPVLMPRNYLSVRIFMRDNMENSCVKAHAILVVIG